MPYNSTLNDIAIFRIHTTRQVTLATYFSSNWIHNTVYFTYFSSNHTYNTTLFVW